VHFRPNRVRLNLPSFSHSERESFRASYYSTIQGRLQKFTGSGIGPHASVPQPRATALYIGGQNRPVGKRGPQDKNETSVRGGAAARKIVFFRLSSPTPLAFPASFPPPTSLRFSSPPPCLVSRLSPRVGFRRRVSRRDCVLVGESLPACLSLYLLYAALRSVPARWPLVWSLARSR
jgi:hypothetical protein